MRAGVHICDAFLVEGLNYGQNFTNNSVFDIINDMAPKFDDAMYYSKNDIFR